MKFVVFALLFLTACASTPQKTIGILAEKCGPTPVNIKDMEAFGFTVPKNKVAVVRIFATWCPYCKEDLTEIGGHFRNGDYKPENVQILLMAYKNPRELKASFDKFLRDTFTKFGIPSSAAQIVMVDRDYKELSTAKNKAGEPLFTGWQGVPFGLVFGKDGRLAYRGHFTNSPQIQDGHYAFIKELANENCTPN